MALPAVELVILIDDNDIDLFVQKRFVEINQFAERVITYNKPAFAVQALMEEVRASDIPQLIFLDLNMPKLNGKQVLKEIKKNNNLTSIPVIMYSTSFAPKDIEEIRMVGAVHHLLKPSRFEDLCNALEKILITDWQKARSENTSL